MDWADMKLVRKVAIAKMLRDVEKIEDTGGSKLSIGAGVAFAGISMIFWQVARVTGSMVATWGCLIVSLFAVPFIHLYCMIDIAILSVWHSRNVYRRMTRNRT